jgi:dynein heavy chain, axonemal
LFHRTDGDETEGVSSLGTAFVVGNGDDFSVSSSQSGVYFVRHTEPGVPVGAKENDIIQELTFGVISGTSALNAMHQILEDVYFPLLQEQQDWGKAAEDGKVEFMSTMRKFEETLSNVVVVQQEGIELRKPDRRYTVSFTPAGFARAAEDPQVVAHFEGLLRLTLFFFFFSL